MGHRGTRRSSGIGKHNLAIPAYSSHPWTPQLNQNPPWFEEKPKQVEGNLRVLSCSPVWVKAKWLRRRWGHPSLPQLFEVASFWPSLGPLRMEQHNNNLDRQGHLESLLGWRQLAHFQSDPPGAAQGPHKCHIRATQGPLERSLSPALEPRGSWKCWQACKTGKTGIKPV